MFCAYILVFGNNKCYVLKFDEWKLYLPIKTVKKNKWTGIPIIGDNKFINQFGVIGNNRRNNKKYNNWSEFSWT